MDFITNIAGFTIAIVAAMFIVDITIEILRGPPFGK